MLSWSMYTIGNTENDNSSPHKLNPEQYRSSNNTNNILYVENWKRWLFEFSRLSVSPLNYRHYIRQMMNGPNESIAIWIPARIISRSLSVIVELFRETCLYICHARVCASSLQKSMRKSSFRFYMYIYIFFIKRHVNYGR